MLILEPRRITSVVLEICKVINGIYHTLQMYQLTEFKIVSMYYFSSLSPGSIQKFSHLGSQSTIGLWPRLTVWEYQISAKCIHYFHSR